MSPAMAAGVSKTLWEIGDIVKLVEAAEAKPAKRGPYKKRAPKFKWTHYRLVAMFDKTTTRFVFRPAAAGFY